MKPASRIHFGKALRFARMGHQHLDDIPNDDTLTDEELKEISRADDALVEAIQILRSLNLG